MIYGLQSVHFKHKDRFNLLQKNIDYIGSNHFTFSQNSFIGGVVINKNHPFCKDDFYFFSEQYNTIVLLSGNIYNRKELLSKYGFEDTVATPTLILQLYLLKKEHFVEELNGDFSIFIHDFLRKTSLLFRDHVGIHPINYCLYEDEFWFCTDYYALSKALNNNTISSKFISRLLKVYGQSFSRIIPNYIDNPNENVLKLLPAHYLKIENQKKKIRKYWHPEKLKINYRLEFEKVVSELEDILIDSVKIRCNSNYKTSFHFSGGLDSTTIAGIAINKCLNQKKYFGFSWSPQIFKGENVGFDERDYVEIASTGLGITPNYSNIGLNDIIEFLKEPRFTTDLYYEPEVRRNAKKNGVNLIFSGHGGDEFISLNGIGIDTDLLINLSFRSFLLRNPISDPKNILRVLLKEVFLPFFNLRYYTRKKELFQYSEFIRKTKKEKIIPINKLFRWKSRNQLQIRLINNLHLQDRTEDWYINGQREGIEYRYPLLDRRIIEYVLMIPSKMQFSKEFDRLLIREIGKKYIPSEITVSNFKNEPVRISSYLKLYEELIDNLILEIDHFKSNPLFDFIDFERLENKVSDHKKGKTNRKSYKDLEILVFLKKAHEFSKKYLNGE